MLRWLIFVATICAALCAEPRFVRPLANITVAVGREAVFTCTIAHLAGHMVAWIKSDSQAILAVDTTVLSHFDRLSVVRNDRNTWTLKLRAVERSDSGSYMCQVNTDPVRHQVGILEVVVPPDIETSETSDDVVVREGGSVRLQCRARGHPPPTITWRREDGQNIVLRERHKARVQTYTGETLHLSRVTRAEMGVYLCIANNGVPPLVSKRTLVSVHFPPSVEVTNGLIGAPLGSEITIACSIEASPPPIYYWATDDGGILLTGTRYRVREDRQPPYSYRVTLVISGVSSDDFRPYACVAKNAVGEAEDTVQLHRIEVPARPPPEQSADAQSRSEARAVDSAPRRGQRPRLRGEPPVPAQPPAPDQPPPAWPDEPSGGAPAHATAIAAGPLLALAARMLR